MRHLWILGCFVGMALLAGCRDEVDAGRQEVAPKIIVCLKIPAMRSLEDAEAIARALADVDGVLADSIECDTEKGVLAWAVCGRSPEEMRHIIAGAGFIVVDDDEGKER